MTVDPLSLGVFANLFSSVAEEMGITLQRASFSPNIKMRRDFSCALFDADGQMLAQAAHIPVHLGAMPMAMNAARQQYDLEPGDVVIMNDPYMGGTHLPDISLISAVFDDNGTRLGYVMSRAHHADVGGMSAGSMPLSTEIYQEGMIIPPIMLARRGEVLEGVETLILRNVRTPEERRGDFAAQMAAQRVGEQRLRALASLYGRETIAEHGAALQSYAERMMRRCIEEIPPDTYRFSDALDNDGQTGSPVRIAVSVTRGAEYSISVDYSGSDPQCLGSLNAVEAVTISATLYVMRCLMREDVPVNAGSMRPLQVIVPAGSVVGARPPAAVAGGNVETSQRIVDVLFGALSQALPGRVPAASQGTMNNLALGGSHPETDLPFAYYETLGGGMGARPGLNGMAAVHDHMSNTLNTPVEAFESTYPVRVRRYSLASGTGGEGTWRGGDGLVRELEFLCTADVTLLTERRVFAPYGLHGGSPGSRGENALYRKGSWQALPGKTRLSALPGDVVRVQTPGGGGMGDLPSSEAR